MRVAILEDDEMTARAVEAVFAGLGHEATLYNEIKSFTWAIENGETPDAIFLDWVLPDGQGTEVCQYIRKKFSLTHPFVAMLTAKDRPHEIVAGFRAGANDYLMKPVSKADIVNSLSVANELCDLHQTIELQKLKLTNTAKLSSLGELAGNIAHEIKNPLTILIERVNEIQHLLSEASLDREALKVHTNGLKDTLERVAQIVSGLQGLILGGSTDLDFSDVNLNDVINDALALAKPRMHSIGVECICDVKSHSKIHGSRTQLGQVVVNLLNNAIYAVENENEKWIKIELEENSGFIELAVSDSGQGIPAELKDKVMEPFFTTRKQGTGSGLGLSLSKSILEAHGGRIYIDEESPHTRFVLKVPGTFLKPNASN